jgi:hypothetical protein
MTNKKPELDELQILKMQWDVLSRQLNESIKTRTISPTADEARAKLVEIETKILKLNDND